MQGRDVEAGQAALQVERVGAGAGAAHAQVAAADAAQGAQASLQGLGSSAVALPGKQGGIEHGAAVTAATDRQAKQTAAAQAQLLLFVVHNGGALQGQRRRPQAQGGVQLGPQRFDAGTGQAAPQHHLPAGAGGVGGQGADTHRGAAAAQAPALGAAGRQQRLLNRLGTGIGCDCRTGVGDPSGGQVELQAGVAAGVAQAQLLDCGLGRGSGDGLGQADTGIGVVLNGGCQGGQVAVGQRPAKAQSVGVAGAGAAALPAHRHTAGPKLLVEGGGHGSRLGLHALAGAALLQHGDQRFDRRGGGACTQVGQVLAGLGPLKTDQIINAVVAGVAAAVAHADVATAHQAFEGRLQVVLGLERAGAQADRGAALAAQAQAQLTGGTAVALQGQHQFFVAGHPRQQWDRGRGDGAGAAGQAQAEAAAAAGRGRQGEQLFFVAAGQRGGGHLGLQPAADAGPGVGRWLQAQHRVGGGQGSPQQQHKPVGAAAADRQVAAADGRQAFERARKRPGQGGVAQGTAAAIEARNLDAGIADAPGVGAFPGQLSHSPQTPDVGRALAGAALNQLADAAAGPRHDLHQLFPG